MDGQAVKMDFRDAPTQLGIIGTQMQFVAQGLESAAEGDKVVGAALSAARFIESLAAQVEELSQVFELRFRFEPEEGDEA